MNKSGSILLRIGVLFMVLGFGSLILAQFDMDFRLISWADPMQPGFGIVLGIVGLAIVALPFVLRGREKTPQATQFAQQPPQYGPGQMMPGQLPGQPYGQPAAGQPFPGGQMPAGPVPGQPPVPPAPGAPQQHPGQH